MPRITAVTCVSMLCTLSGPTFAATSSDINQCNNWNNNPTIVIKACTNVLKSDGLAKQEIALAYLNRAVAHSKLGEIEVALKDYDQSILNDPNNPNAYTSRGAAFRVLGQFERSMRDLDQALSLEPNSPYAYNNRCFLKAEALGHYEEALADCELAYQLAPNNGAIVHSLATVYEGLGNTYSAMQAYFHSLQLDPNLQESKDALERLEIQVRHLGEKSDCIAEDELAQMIDSMPVSNARTTYVDDELVLVLEYADHRSIKIINLNGQTIVYANGDSDYAVHAADQECTYSRESAEKVITIPERLKLN